MVTKEVTNLEKITKNSHKDLLFEFQKKKKKCVSS